MEAWQRNLYILIFAQLVTAVGFSSIFPFLPLYVGALGSQSGLSVELLAGLVISAQALTMMIASPIWGSVADRYGRKRMVERAMFGGAIIILLMGFVRSAEELVLLGVQHGDLGPALSGLSPELRAVVQATVLDGLTAREAARLLDLPVGTVKTRLRRAKAQLREQLA